MPPKRSRSASVVVGACRQRRIERLTEFSPERRERFPAARAPRDLAGAALRVVLGDRPDRHQREFHLQRPGPV